MGVDCVPGRPSLPKHQTDAARSLKRRPGFIKTLRYCTTWALGHGFVLLISGLLLFGLGIVIPESLVHLAEIMVGLFLIGMGFFCFWRFRRERIALVEHRHGEIKHRHWQIEGDQAHARARADDKLGRQE